MQIMQKVLESVIGGAVTYVVSIAVLDALITGTETADTIFTTIVPIAIAAVTIMAIFFGHKTDQGGGY